MSMYRRNPPPSKQAVNAGIVKIISEQLGIQEHLITPEKELEQNLGCDSLDMVELVMALEDEFGIEIVDEDAEKLYLTPNRKTTVEDIFVFMHKELKCL